MSNIESFNAFKRIREQVLPYLTGEMSGNEHDVLEDIDSIAVVEMKKLDGTYNG